MQFQEFLEFAFYGLLSGATLWGVSILSKLQASIAELNEKVAQILERTSWHERELERLDRRIDRVENQGE
mgnify:CR=1 FL=1